MQRTVTALFLLCLFFGAEAKVAPSTDEDILYRTRAVEELIQVGNELIANQAGVFILFTPTHGTAFMISDQGEIPQGLVAKSRKKSYEATIPWLNSIRELPANNIKCILIRSSEHRPQVEDGSKVVDETYYKDFIAKYAANIKEIVILPQQFESFMSRGMPTVFYFYAPNAEQEAYFTAGFGRAINAPSTHKMSDPFIYHNRERDLRVVNDTLRTIGLPTVEQILTQEHF